MSMLSTARVNSFSIIDLNGHRHVQFADGKVLSLYLVRNMARAMDNKEFLAAVDKAAGFDLKVRGGKKVAGERIHRVFQSKSNSFCVARGTDRVDRQNYLINNPTSKVRRQRRGKKVEVTKVWLGNTARKQSKVKNAVKAAEVAIDNNLAAARMTVIKGYAVADPYAAKDLAWANRAIADGLNPRQRVSHAKPNYYLTPASDWMPVVYATQQPIIKVREYKAHPKTAYGWDTALAVENQRRADVWARRTIHRAANRAAFTLEAVYQLLGYDAKSLTVVKQPDRTQRPQEFKSVGAAAYQPPQTQQNKANNTATTQGVTMSNLGLMQILIDAAVNAGGTLSSVIQIDKNKRVTGKVVAGLVYINDTGMPVINNLGRCDDYCLIKNYPESCFKPESTEGMSHTLGLTYAPDVEGNLEKANAGQVVFHLVRYRGTQFKVMDGQTKAHCESFFSAAYIPYDLTTEEADGSRTPIGDADVHFVVNLPGRQPRKGEGAPDSDIVAPRQYVRDIIYTGAASTPLSIRQFLKANEGFNIDVIKPLNKCVAEGQDFYYKGNRTGVHVALVIAEIANVNGVDDIERWTTGIDNSGQARVYVDKAAIVYLPVDALFKLFLPTPEPGNYNRHNTGMWPMFPQLPCNELVNHIYLLQMMNERERWGTYNRLCSPPLLLGDIQVANTPQAEVATTAEVEAVKPAVTTPAPLEITQEITMPEVKLDPSVIARELAAYDAARLAALKGDPVKPVDNWGDLLVNDYHFEAFKAERKNFAPAQAKAALAVAAIAGTMGSIIADSRVKCKGYHWEVSHLETLIDVIKDCLGSTRFEVEENVFMPAHEYFKLQRMDDGSTMLWMEGKPTFRILPNRVVVDVNRNRIFQNTIELAYPTQDAEDLRFYLADSFSNFMHYFVNGMMQLLGSYYGKVENTIPTNYRANCIKFLDNMPSIRMSKDNWHEENGAARFLMENEWKPCVAQVIPFLANGKHHELGSGAHALSKIHHRYDSLNKVKDEKNPDKFKVIGLNDMNTGAMSRIMGEKYLESHFTKASYFPFGSVHISLLKEHCPTLLAQAEQFLGKSFSHPQTALVIIMTLKATKGLKRITLAMAQAARPVKEHAAGFLLRNQNLRTVGTAVNVLLAPSLVAPPGQNYLINPLAEIAAYVDKYEKNYMLASYVIDETTGHPFEFDYSACQSIRDNTWTVEDRNDAWTYVVPQKPAFIEGNKPLLFTVKTDDENAIDINDVYHERDYEAQLIWIRFRVEQSVAKGASNLVIEYHATWVENNGKIRSFNKAQVIRRDPNLVRNGLNPTLNDIVFDMVCTQDALKLDTLYSMLMLIGNTVNANYKRGNKSPKIVEMYNRICKINTLIGEQTKEADPVLVIDEVAVACGLYQPLLQYFEDHFVHPEGIWFDWQNDAAQARIVYEIYSNKSKVEGKKKTWEEVAAPMTVFPELSGYINVSATYKVVAYKELGEITNKTNILVFILDTQGIPTGYLQRTYVLCGDADAPLVNVELYESSTVQESVSTSSIDLPTIVALEHCIDDPALVQKIQKEMLRGGRDAMLRFAALCYAEADLPVYENLTTINIAQVGENLVMSAEDKAKLLAKLQEYNINETCIAQRGSSHFKQMCHALRHFDFVMAKSATSSVSYESEGWEDFGDGWEDFGDGCAEFEEDFAGVAPSTSANFRLWMPALYSFTKLTSRNENNQDFVAIFYKNILKPLLRGETPLAQEAQRCFNVMRSLLNSEDMLKLPCGKQNVTAKRVAVGDARIGEIHVVVNNNPKSPHQKGRRQKIGNGSIVNCSRKPLAIGYIGRIIHRRNVKVVDGEGNLIRIKQMIYRPNEEPVEARYFLSDVQIGTDVFLPTAYDRGDFDGDTFYITLIEALGVIPNTWDQGYKVLAGASKYAPFAAENGSYFCDHYGIKTYSDAMKTMASGIVKSITKEEDGVKKGALVDLNVHAKNNATAIKIQHGAVGVAYAVYIIGMIMVNIFSYGSQKFSSADKFTEKVLKVLMRPDIKHLVGIVSEMYEVMLGGPDHGPNKYREILDRIMTGERFETTVVDNPTGDKAIAGINKNAESKLNWVRQILIDNGMKDDNYVEIAAIMELTSIYYGVKKNFSIVYKEGKIDSTNVYNWVATATFIFELGRNKFIGFSGVGRADESFSPIESKKNKANAHKNCATVAFSLAAVLDPYTDNIYFDALVDVYKTLGAIITYTPAQMKGKFWNMDDLKLFAEACSDQVIDVEATDEDDSDDGGSVVVDDAPNQPDDNDGGNIIKELTNEHVEESTEVTQTSVEPYGAVEEPVEYEEEYSSDEGCNDSEPDFEYDYCEECDEPDYTNMQPTLVTAGTTVEDTIAAASPLVVEPVAAPMPFANEWDRLSDFLLQQLAERGEQLTVRELVNSLNAKQQNKANKLDDVVEKSVPEVKEIVNEVVEPAPAAVEPELPKAVYYAGVGSRKTPPEILKIMTAMGKVMAEQGFTLRSGGAEGADQAFEKSCLQSGGACEIYLPFNGFNGRTDSNHGCDPNGVSYLDATQLPNYAQAQQILKETLDPTHFSRLKGKALQLQTRNVYQVLGFDLNTPVTSVYCWTPDGALTGGTATAIKLANRYNIPVVNLGNPEHLAYVKNTLSSINGAEAEIKKPVANPVAQVETVASAPLPGSEPAKTEEVAPAAEVIQTTQVETTQSAPLPNEQPATQTQPQAAPPTASPAKLEKVQKLMAPLTDEQKAVVKTVGNELRNTFLTGKGGAGKSFTVEIIRKCYDVLGYPYIVVGSTGTSVVNIDGHNTFNGMFGLSTGFDDKRLNKDKPQDGKKKKKQKNVVRNESDWKTLVTWCRGSKQFSAHYSRLKHQMNVHQRPLLIIVDEVSQCDSLLLNIVENGLNARKVKHQWLLVGDPMQFEPVDGSYFFKDVEVICEDGSKQVKQSPFNMKELNFIGFNLKNNMRAKGDKEWSDALDLIRMGYCSGGLPAIVEERWKHSENNPVPEDAMVVSLTNKTVNRFNEEATQKLLDAGAHAETYTGKIETKIVVANKRHDYWLWANEKYPGDETIFSPINYKVTLCVGMRVMLRSTNMKTNGGDIEVNNGQTGTVRFLGKDYVKVAFDNGVTKDVKRIEMEDPAGRGTFKQIPLVPAYALTISKTQGMTFNIPVVFHMYSENRNDTITPIFVDNAFYVALSRLTTSKHCWFETKVNGIDGKTKQVLEPYTMMVMSCKTNLEAFNFTDSLS